MNPSSVGGNSSNARPISSITTQSTSNTPALTREQVLAQLDDYQKTINRYFPECEWDKVREAYQGMAELLENVRNQDYFPKQEIEVRLTKLYTAYSAFERGQGDTGRADELAQKVDWCKTSLQTSPKKRSIERENSSLYRPSKEIVPEFLARPRAIPTDPALEALINGVNKINLQGHSSLLLQASIQTTQPFVWPTSLDEIKETAYLVACLREGRRGSAPVNFGAYQELAECALEHFLKQRFYKLSWTQEAVILAQALDNQTYFRQLIHELKPKTDDILNMTALQGLAVIMQYRAHLMRSANHSGQAQNNPDLNLANDCTVLLDNIHQLLKLTHRKDNALQLGALLQTASLLLDTMFDAGFTLEPTTLKDSLEKSLKVLADSKDTKGHMNESLAFQAEYALQALKRLRHRGGLGSRIWAIVQDLSGGAAYAAGAFASGDVDKFWEAANRTLEGIRKIKDEWNAHYKEQEWYPALYCIGKGIQLGYLNGLEQFVREWRFSNKNYLLQGLCFHLEKMVFSSADNAAKEWALDFLKSLKAGDAAWGPAKNLAGVRECADATLKRIVHFWNLPNTELMEHVDYAPPAWLPFWQNPPQQSKLLQVVQEARQQQRHHQMMPVIHETVLGHSSALNSIQNNLTEASTGRAKIQTNLENISAGMNIVSRHFLPASRNEWLPEVKKALYQHYASDLKIKRISGKELDLEHCYINLAIVESKVQQNEDKAKLKEQAEFYRLASYEEVKQTNLQKPILLEELFAPRKLRSGEGIAKRAIILGRPGSGKSTLCKKIVHLYQTEGLWNDRFEAVLWLPLRQLKTYNVYNLEKLLKHKYFSQHTEGSSLAAQLKHRQDKILFILDGLDEIAADLDHDPKLKKFLDTLLDQPHVIVTSRPAGVDTSPLDKFDLQLETIGFSQDNVQQYVKAVEPEAAADIQELLDSAPIMKELLNIPAILDAVCYTRKEVKALLKDGAAITMTTLYQTMVDKLLLKDAARLNKKLNVNDLKNASRGQIRKRMTDAINYLGYLSFKGLQENVIEFDSSYLQVVTNELEEKLDKDEFFSLQSDIQYASFLHKTDVSHFLHLTLQEYFAAEFLAGHFQAYLTATGTYQSPTEVRKKGLVLSVAELEQFVNENKYNPRYQMMWQMVAGSLEDKATLEGFFHLLEKAPRDLKGAAHSSLSMHCLHEARVRLSQATILRVEKELEEGLQLIIGLSGGYYGRWIESRAAFPEHLLLRFYEQHRQYKRDIWGILRKRLVLSDQARVMLRSELQNEERNAGVRRELIETLAPWVANDPVGRDDLIQRLAQEQDVDVRCAVIAALAPWVANDPVGRDDFIQRLAQEQNAGVRCAVIVALAPWVANDQAVLDCFIQRLAQEQDADVKYELIAALALRVANDPVGRDDFIQRLAQEQDVDVRRVLIGVLALWVASDPVGRNDFIQRLVQEQDADVRCVVIAALALWVANDQAVRDDFIQRLAQEQDADVKYELIAALAPWVANDQAVLDCCIQHLAQEQDADVRYELIAALAPCASNEAVRNGLIQHLAQEQDVDVRRAVIGALAPWVVNDPIGRDDFIQRLAQEQDTNVRYELIGALAPWVANDQAIRDDLIQYLGLAQEQDANVRRTVIKTLAPWVANDQAVRDDLIQRLAQEQDVDVRRAVIETLAPWVANDQAVLDCFIQRSAQERDAWTRFEILSILSRNTREPEVLLAVLRLLKSAKETGIVYRGLNVPNHQAYFLLPHLSFNQLKAFYKNFLFIHCYDDNANRPIYYQDKALHYYTATGQGEPIPLSDEQFHTIDRAFKEARKDILTKFIRDEEMIGRQRTASSASKWFLRVDKSKATAAISL